MNSQAYPYTIRVKYIGKNEKKTKTRIRIICTPSNLPFVNLLAINDAPHD